MNQLETKNIHPIISKHHLFEYIKNDINKLNILFHYSDWLNNYKLLDPEPDYKKYKDWRLDFFIVDIIIENSKLNYYINLSFENYTQENIYILYELKNINLPSDINKLIYEYILNICGCNKSTENNHYICDECFIKNRICYICKTWSLHSQLCFLCTESINMDECNTDYEDDYDYE